MGRGAGEEVRSLALALFVAAILAVNGRALAADWRQNQGVLHLMAALLGAPAEQPRALAFLERAKQAGKQEARWGLGLLAYVRGAHDVAQEEFRALIVTAPERIRLVHTLYPDDVELARLAEESHPEQAFAAFWVGETLAQSDPTAAMAAYERGLRLDPTNGVRWVELGWLYRNHGRYQEALMAYNRACELRDRGGNGCWQAGLLSEELGQYADAARYYRLTLDQIPGYAPALVRLRALP